MTTPGARFDSLIEGTALAFAAPARTIVATRPEEVVSALDAVDAATRDGAWAYGFVSYEAAPGLDPALRTREIHDGDPPLVWFGIGAAPAAVDPVPAPPDGACSVSPWRLAPDAGTYLRAVEQVRDHIAAGDTYQVNLTVRMHADVTGDPHALYAAMARRQHGDHAACIDTGAHVIASASPELFFDWRGDRLLTRPMKGTMPRGHTVTEDDERRHALATNDKERAENVIVVDLLRNDLGRVARTGSVRVERLGTVEQYGTVLQLTSDVTARIDPDTSLSTVFRALFPSGSVTGAPKAGTMSIIRELEAEPRGVYCGAVGWVAPPGSPTRARFSVAIRTAVVDRARGTAVYGTGGGITWGSSPQAELAELLLKTRVAEPAEPVDLLETMRFDAGAIVNLDAHMDRMARSAHHLGFGFDRSAVVRRLRAATDPVDAARVRLTVSRDGTPTVELARLPPAATGPVTLAIDDDPIDSTADWPRHKTTHREPYTRRAARHDTDDVVLVNERGHVTEATIANLAVLLDGRWWTPPVEDGCLPGVERGRLLAAAVLRERHLTRADLRRADGLALVSSLRGWRPAVLAEN